MAEEKSYYEVYRERVKRMATELERAPKEVAQHILWLKSAAMERIENIDNLTKADGIYTVRVNKGQEISLSKAIELRGEQYKFGISEPYVNLLMHYAYEAGLKSREGDFKRTTERMDKALKDISDILSDLGYGEE